MQDALNRIMRKFSATLQIGPHDYLNQAFGWSATLEWGDLPSQKLQVSGANPQAALQGMTVVATAKFDEDAYNDSRPESDTNRVLRLLSNMTLSELETVRKAMGWL